VTEQELLLDCLRRLNAGGISYMVTGSMASNAWGVPRTTHDLDLVIQLSPSQIEKFVKQFDAPDFFVDETMVRAAYKPPYQFNILHIPSALKVDFWTLKSDPFEQEMFRRKIRDIWDGETIWLATAEDVILHKLYWNKLTPSNRQLGDVGGVIAVQGAGLDQVYLKTWAARLSVVTELEEALAGRYKPKQT
jgi:hypothetical protein